MWVGTSGFWASPSALRQATSQDPKLGVLRPTAAHVCFGTRSWFGGCLESQGLNPHLLRRNPNPRSTCTFSAQFGARVGSSRSAPKNKRWAGTKSPKLKPSTWCEQRLEAEGIFWPRPLSGRLVHRLALCFDNDCVLSWLRPVHGRGHRAAFGVPGSQTFRLRLRWLQMSSLGCGLMLCKQSTPRVGKQRCECRQGGPNWDSDAVLSSRILLEPHGKGASHGHKPHPRLIAERAVPQSAPRCAHHQRTGY